MEGTVLGKPPLLKESVISLPTAAKKKKRNKKKNINKPQEIYKKEKEKEVVEEYSSSDVEDYSDDEDEGKEGYKKGGYHPVNIDDLFKGRYRVLEKLGWGHFSTVWLCQDQKLNRHVALKIVKSAKHYTEAALDEIKILQTVARHDPENKKCCVTFLDDFEHKGPHGKHMCMVFEVMGSNLLDLIKHYNYHGIPVPVVKSICKQVLIALDYLHTTCRVIHTDLKPENVLLYSNLPKNHKRKRDKESGSNSDEEYSEDFEEVNFNATREGSSEDHTNMENGISAIRLEEKIVSETNQVISTEGGDSTSNMEVTTQLSESTIHSSEILVQQPTAQLGVKESEQSGSMDSSPIVPLNIPSKSHIVYKDIDEEDPSTYRVKLADFGNACWTHEHFTNDIQTRQYRAPEVILGSSYSISVDMWSMGCMVFELLTGDLLFEPKNGSSFNKNDDHLAQMLELLGKMPKRLTLSGKYSKDYFDRKGELKYIRSLHYWPLEEVLKDKYKWDKDDAKAAASFILPMLDYFPERRATAADMLKSPWLKGVPPLLPNEEPSNSDIKKN